MRISGMFNADVSHRRAWAWKISRPPILCSAGRPVRQSLRFETRFCNADRRARLARHAEIWRGLSFLGKRWSWLAVLASGQACDITNRGLDADLRLNIPRISDVFVKRSIRKWPFGRCRASYSLVLCTRVSWCWNIKAIGCGYARICRPVDQRI